MGELPADRTLDKDAIAFLLFVHKLIKAMYNDIKVVFIFTFMNSVWYSDSGFTEVYGIAIPYEFRLATKI